MDALLAAVNSLNTGEIRYAPADGTLIWKKAIIRYTEEFYHKKVNPENVIASGGAKQQLWLPCSQFWTAGRNYLSRSLLGQLSRYGKTVRRIGVAALPETELFIRGSEILKQRVGSYTRAVIINSPNNPSGAMYSEEFIADIVEYCEKKDLYLIMDGYLITVLSSIGRKPSQRLRLHKKIDWEIPKLSSSTACSKQYAMRTGFRIGDWAVGNKKNNRGDGE